VFQARSATDTYGKFALDKKVTLYPSNTRCLRRGFFKCENSNVFGEKKFMKSHVLSPSRVFVLGALALLACHSMTHVAQAAPKLSVRVKVTSIAGKAPAAAQKFKLSWGDVQEFSGGSWSEWSPFVGYNGEGLYPTACHVEPSPAIEPFPRLKLDVELAVDGGEKSANKAELYAKMLRIMVWKSGDGQVHLDTGGGHTSRVYGPHFKAAEIPLDERPKQISFSDRYIAGHLSDNNLLGLEAGLSGLAGLGINTNSFEDARGQPAIREVMMRAGFKKVWGAVYEPPGYAFNFGLKRQETFDAFVKKQLKEVTEGGWTKDQIAQWVTSDEPAWYLPSLYAQFNNDPNAMDAFHAYLKVNGQTLETLGKERWADVRTIGRKEYKDLPSRRLFYWSQRFASVASARFFGEVTKTFEKQIRPGVPVIVNFNNFMGLFYNSGPVANNPDRGPNAAMGQHDWLDFGRERGTTAIATEDWFGDWAADNWSFYAARLRSAAELSGDPKVGIAGLIIPRVSGQPAGMSKKILALVGNGAKTVQFFTYGPEYAFPGNCWSENFPVYKEIAAGTRLVGKAEDLMFPGKIRRPEVALLTPQSSQLWDLEDQNIANGLSEATNTNMHGGRMEYTSEMFSIYHALQRAAIPANFVDEKGLTEASLKNYKVLYVTAPDIPKESLEGLLNWVRAGGVLVTLPGAGQFDRYHQPVNTLNEATGIAPEKAMREISDWNNAGPNGTFKVNDQTLTVYGRREPLKVTDAKATDAFEDGKPAVTWKAVGQGKIMHFSFLPGLSYFKATAQPGVPNRLYAGGGMRDLIAAPVRSAKVNLPVTVSQPVIEAPALYSAKGVAVTLIKYGEEEKHALVEPVEISVAVDAPVKRVESAQKGKLEFKQTGKKVTVSLPFGDVDVVNLYY